MSHKVALITVELDRFINWPIYFEHLYLYYTYFCEYIVLLKYESCMLITKYLENV